MKTTPENNPNDDVFVSFMKDVYLKMCALQKTLTTLTGFLAKNGVLQPHEVKEIQLTMLDAITDDNVREKAKRDVVAQYAGIVLVPRSPEADTNKNE